nr:MAG TPA: hypothetical protein [Caudoviricetes sp.]DAM97923.1 MAG TPA: hypothetical protein [Caudoviricetes sp.]
MLIISYGTFQQLKGFIFTYITICSCYNIVKSLTRFSGAFRLSLLLYDLSYK